MKSKTKLCKKCNKEKPLEEMYKGHECRLCKNEYNRQWRLKNLDKDRAAKSRYYEKNKERYREREKEWRKNNPHLVRNTMYKYKYGITLEQYEKMVQERQGLCDICQLEQKLYVDHCHDTNKVRGLICNSCNKALGLFYDSLVNLNRAINYLTIFKKEDEDV